MEGTLVFYFGLDYIKGTLFTSDKSEKLTIEKPLDIYMNEEYVEQDPEQWLHAVIGIIKEVSEQKEDIANMTVTYQPGTFVCIDRSGNHIMNAILPCDRRAKYQAHISHKSLKKQSSVSHIPWDYMILPRLQWIKYNKPDVYKRLFKVLTPDGYIAYRLCGETGIDNYSAAFLGYNLRNNEYNDRVVDSLGLDINTFPGVYKTGECIGVLSGVTKEKFNLSSDIKFIISTNSIIPLASMNDTYGKSNVIFDTESCSIYFVDNLMKSKKISELIRLPYKEDKFIYSFLGNYEMLFLKNNEKSWVNYMVEDEDYMIGSNGLIVMPYLMGDSAFYNTDIRASIIGIDNSNLSNFITACYESIGYVLKDKIDYILNTGTNIETIEVLSHIENELFYKILSNITGKKIIINNEESSIAEYAYYSCIGYEKKNDTVSTEIIPEEKAYYKYQQLSKFYKSAYNSLADIYKYRRKVLKRITV